MSDASEPPRLRTSLGEFALHEYRLRVDGREWSVLHTGAMLTPADESRFFGEPGEREDKLPFGVALWPAAIALAHEIASRPAEFRGGSVLELGAGTGLPGIVAASLGATVVQTDRHEVPMWLCRRNGERNGVAPIEYRLADWAEWGDARRYDWILGSDVLYAESAHPHLRGIFEANLAAGGRILLSDPFRGPSLELLEAMEKDGWEVVLIRWNVGEKETSRPIGVYELKPPR